MIMEYLVAFAVLFLMITINSLINEWYFLALFAGYFCGVDSMCVIDSNIELKRWKHEIERFKKECIIHDSDYN